MASILACLRISIVAVLILHYPGGQWLQSCCHLDAGEEASSSTCREGGFTSHCHVSTDMQTGNILLVIGPKGAYGCRRIGHLLLKLG
ncbi:hypothetical protein BDW67DRAFT_167815 [Aspergillus spinulosporus]